MGGATYRMLSHFQVDFFSPPYIHNLKQKFQNQAAFTTKRLTAKGESGKKKKKRQVCGWSDCSAASHFSLCFCAQNVQIGFHQNLNRGSIQEVNEPKHCVGGHAGAGGIFLIIGAAIISLFIPCLLAEVLVAVMECVSVVGSLAPLGPWCPGTGCCRMACGGRSGRASLGSLSARLGMGRGGSRMASPLKDTHSADRMGGCI